MTTPAPLPSWPPYDGWLAGGERLALPRLARTVFTRVDGVADGPPVTLTLDLLGFGDSDKPPGHRYSLFEQADLVEEVWELLGVQGGALVAHDYGVTVAQELLARGARLDRVAFLNGGLYPDLHRPTDVQQALLSPGGAKLAAALTPERASLLRVPPPSYVPGWSTR